jgi:peptidoglycan/LPS O-acetylase OafA/YrhL
MVSPRTLAKICVTLIVASLIARIYLAATDAHPILIYTNTVTRMDTLAIGALVAVAVRDGEWWARLQRNVGWMFAVALGTLALLWALIGAFAEYHPLMQTAGFTALAVLFAALIAHALAAPAGSPIARVFSSSVLRSFGKYSYAMYLFHETIAVIIVPRLPFGEVHALWAQLARFAVLAPITVVAAVLSWHLFEKHLLALKRFFPGTSATAPAPAAR